MHIKLDSIRDIFGDRKEIIRKLFIIFLGNLFCSMAINLFFVPNGLLSGGVGGLGIIVQYLTGIPTGITVFVLNLPIFLIGYKILNKKFLVYAFISMFVFSSILTATAVSVSGAISFVGLIVPHIIRLLIGPDHRLLIPASTLGGSIFLLLCDLIGRTIVAPGELGVGIITSIIGAPYFLFLLNRARKEGVAL